MPAQVADDLVLANGLDNGQLTLEWSNHLNCTAARGECNHVLLAHTLAIGLDADPKDNAVSISISMGVVSRNVVPSGFWTVES